MAEIKITVPDGKYCGDCPLINLTGRYRIECVLYKQELLYHAMIDRYEKCMSCYVKCKET